MQIIYYSWQKKVRLLSPSTTICASPKDVNIVKIHVRRWWMETGYFHCLSAFLPAFIPPIRRHLNSSKIFNS
jgi:hypothetical protein